MLSTGELLSHAIVTKMKQNGPGKCGIKRIVGMGAALLLVVIAASRALAESGQPTQPAPPPASEPALQAKIGCYLLFLGDLDFLNKTFAAELWLWSNTPGKEEGPLKSIEFVNAKTVTLSLAQAEASTNGIYFAEKATGVFRHQWDTHNFPFDRHTLKIAFESSKDDRSALIFAPDVDKSSIHTDIRLDGWEIKKFSIAESPSEYQTDFGDPKSASPHSQFSRVTMSVEIKRNSYMGFFKVAAGVYFAVLMAVLSFFLETTQPSLMSPKMSILGAALFAILVNLRGAESVLGRTEMVTLVDKLHHVAMIYVALAAVIAVLSRRLVDQKREAAAKRVDKVGFWGFVSTYLLINVFLIVRAYYVG